jgi:hypothetical protein
MQYLLQSTDWINTNDNKHRLPNDTIQLLFHDKYDDGRNNDSNNNNANQQSLQPNTDVLFATLQNAKFALEFWQSLSIRDALRLDYKMFSIPTQSATTTPTTTTRNCFGISTVLMPYHEFQQKQDFKSNVIGQYINDMGILFLCIMLASSNPNTGNLNREIVFIGPNTTFIDEMMDYFLNTDRTLQLVEMSPASTTTIFHDDDPIVDSTTTTTSTLCIRAFQQNNNAASRKQVAPLLLKYFSTTDEAM